MKLLLKTLCKIYGYKYSFDKMQRKHILTRYRKELSIKTQSRKNTGAFISTINGTSWVNKEYKAIVIVWCYISTKAKLGK